MKRKRIGWIGIVALVALVFAGCGGASSGGSESSGITDLSSLPRATSPMADSVSTSTSASKSVSKAATIGLGVLSTTADDFSADSSMGGCEMFNLIKQGVASAAQADMILCFIAAMNDQDSFANLSDSSGDSVDVYDSAWHIFNLNIVSDDEEDGAPDRIKMRVVKDESGSITNFEMFMCSLVDGSLVQNEYTSQEISDSSLAMTAVGFHSDAYGSGGHSVDVTGTLDGSGAFTERIVTLSDSGNYGGGLHSQSGILTQLPGSFAFEGYRYGTHEGGSYQDVIIGIGEMLGDNSSELSSLAVGDGAVVYSSSGTYDGGTYEHSGTDAWLGDGCLPIEPPDSSSFYEEANAGTLPTVGDVSIGFAADQTWDCTDDVGVGIVDLPITEQSMMNAACSAYAVDHEWVNCWEIIQP